MSSQHNPIPTIDYKIKLSRIILILGLAITVCFSLYFAILVHVHAHLDSEAFQEVNPLDLLKLSNLRLEWHLQHHRSVVDVSFLFKTSKSGKYSDHDYGGLKIKFLNDTKRRLIMDHEDNERGHIFDKDIDGDDWVDPYYAFDDDFLRNRDNHDKNCRRVSWYRLHTPNCNTIHETPLFQVPIVNNGYYRDVFNFTDEFLVPSPKSTTSVMMKKLRYKHNTTDENFEFVRMDAIVMERLTSSPRIANIFGHCGNTIIQEAFEADIQDLIVPGSGYLKSHKLNDKHDVDPQNVFTPSQKLRVALDLAQPIADLHGFEGGVITHNDIQLCQFLFTKTNKLTLNDFNRAEIMLWDADEKTYCKYRSGKGHGPLRAPEEYLDEPLDEKIDIFSYGNLIYSVLTGLWNFYELGDNDDGFEKLQRKVVNKKRAFIDPRYKNRTFAESALVNLIEKCWAHKASDRPDIFQIVDYLKQALKKDMELKKNNAS